jgi:outer membrane protein
MTCAPNTRKRHGLFSLTLAALCAVGSSSVQAMTLSDALRRAAEHDPAIAESLATYDADREAGRQERGTLLPSINATGSYTYMDVDRNESTFFVPGRENYETWNAGVELRQPLFRLDWFARTDRAAARDAVADAGLASRTQTLLSRVADRYFSVLVAQDNVEQARSEATAVRKSLEDTRKRYEVELVPGTDLKEAKARDDLARALLLVAERELEAARDALDETTGNGNAALPALLTDTRFPPITPADPESWVQAARDHNPQLIVAREQYKIATADVRSQQSLAAPSLDAVAGYGRDDTSESIVGQKVDQGTVGVQLTVPLFAGGINASRVREARARERVAESSLRRLTLETERETRQLFRLVQTGYAEIDAYKLALESASAAAEATRYGYDAGTRTISDVLDADSRIVQARRSLNQARYTVLLNLLQLKRTVGALNERDFLEIDQLLSASSAASN